MIWEKFPQIIFTVETWHSLTWYLILMMQQHSSPLICTNDSFIQCIFLKLCFLKKLIALIFHPSVMILVLQAAQPFMSWSLQSTLALWEPKASSTWKVWGCPSCLVPWHSGDCKHFIYIKITFSIHRTNHAPSDPSHSPLRALHCSILFWGCAGHSWHRAAPRGCPEPPGPSQGVAVLVLQVELGMKGSPPQHQNRSCDKYS